MTIQISTVQDERAFEAYKALRNLPRNSLTHSVYAGSKITLQHYADLEAALSGDMSDYAEYHATSTAPVAEHIETLRAAMETIVQVVETVETFAPGTFGVTLPDPEPEEEQPEE